MSNRRKSIRGTHIAGAALAALLALSAYAVPAVAPFQPQAAGASVHAKNGDTPEWILQLQTRNARQMPIVVENDEPSYWI